VVVGLLAVQTLLVQVLFATRCTLKRSPEPSHTQGLLDRSRGIMEQR
jgi:hypothetical protein